MGKITKLLNFALLVLLIIVVCSILYSESGFECGPPQCSSSCSVTGTYCKGYDPCCGYCTNDGGKTKSYCCESCVSNPI
jgi:hypothetical protein